jgi:hypothetical protein
VKQKLKAYPLKRGQYWGFFVGPIGLSTLPVLHHMVRSDFIIGIYDV